MALILFLLCFFSLICYLLKDVPPTEEEKRKKRLEELEKDNWNTFVDYFNKGHGGNYLKKK